jgi:hypothetical protein
MASPEPSTVHADDGVKSAASNSLRGLRQAQNGERKTGYSSRCASPSSPVPQDGGGRPRLTTTTSAVVHVCRLHIKRLSARPDEPSVKRRRLCYSLGTSADAETANCLASVVARSGPSHRVHEPAERPLHPRRRQSLLSARSTLALTGQSILRYVRRFVSASQLLPLIHLLLPNPPCCHRQNARQCRSRIGRQRRICYRTDRDKRFQIATSHRHQPDPYLLRMD